MAYDPNAPLTVLPAELWFTEHPNGGVAFCDPFVQQGDLAFVLSPPGPADPSRPPRAFAGSEALGPGYRFFDDATTKLPNLEIGVLLTRASHPDDLDGRVDGVPYVDEFEEVLVPGSDLVAYAMADRLVLPLQVPDQQWRHEYGRRIVNAADETGLPLVNIDPLMIGDMPPGPTEGLVQAVNHEALRAMGLYGPEGGQSQAVELRARDISQWYMVGSLGLHLAGLENAPNGPVLLVVGLAQSALASKLEAVIGLSDSPRVAASLMRPGIEIDRDREDARILSEGRIVLD